MNSKVLLDSLFRGTKIRREILDTKIGKYEPGVYGILCEPTQKIYVGSTIYFGERWIMHRSQLRRNVHACKAMQEDFLRYGESCFVFIPIERPGLLFLSASEFEWGHLFKNKRRLYNSNKNFWVRPQSSSEAWEQRLQ